MEIKTCEKCGKVAEVKIYATPDLKDGTRTFKVLCDDCAEELRKGGKSVSDREKSPFKASLIYEVFSVILLIAGILGGIISGVVFPKQAIEYEHPLIQSGGKIVEEFNAPLMFYIWIATGLLFFCFFAVYAHLRNQEAILEEIRKKSPEEDR